MANEEKLAAMRHSLAHLLATAILELYPGTKNTIGPAIDTGFYYDFEFPEGNVPTEKELGKIDRDVMKITEGEGFGAEALEIEKPDKLDQ
jgi:threonyl-tRNA synthetase